MVTHTLEALVVEDDLAKELLLGAAMVGLDSLASDEGYIVGVPGGVRSLAGREKIKRAYKQIRD